MHYHDDEYHCTDSDRFAGFVVLVQRHPHILRGDTKANLGGNAEKMGLKKFWLLAKHGPENSVD